MTSAPPLSPFELLPYELRAQIYDYLLSPSYTTSIGTFPDLLHSYSIPQPFVPLLHLNRKIYNETHPIVYAQHGPVLVVTGNRIIATWTMSTFALVGLSPPIRSSEATWKPEDIAGRLGIIRVQHEDYLQAAIGGEDAEAEEWQTILVGWKAVRKFVRWLQIFRKNNKILYLQPHQQFN